MPLSNSQLATLKADIAANTNTIPVGRPFAGTQINALPNTPDANFEIALWYNQTASPAYKVYREQVPMAEIMLNGFDWTRVDNLSVGKARVWDWMFNASAGQTVDPSKPNVRSGINSVWVGTQADLNVRAAVYLHCFRDSTWAEKLLKSSGNGSACDQNGDGPATLGYRFPLNRDDVESARNLP